MKGKKILILGGTGEAAELTRQLSQTLPDTVEIITSFAGRTKSPPELPGRIISGGFGGIQGLKTFIETENITLLIDATHPFADIISENAYIACAVTNTLRLTLSRPEWNLPAHAKWVEVDDLTAACDAVLEFSKRCFLTTGTGGLDAFSGLDDVHFLVRLIEPPAEPLPLQNHQIIIARPPHDADAERKLIDQHRIDCLVSKHAGGAATEGKILAALEADIPIILVRRPPYLPGTRTESIDECLSWVRQQI